MLSSLMRELLEEEEVMDGFTALFNSPDFWAPLTSSAILSRGTGAPSFTRATTRTCTDHEGKVNTLLAGEIGFQGARRVRNEIAGSSEDLTNAAWSKLNGGTGTAPTVTLIAATLPNGAAGTVSRVQLNKGAGNTGGDFSGVRQIVSAVAGTVYGHSFWMKSNDASSYVVCINGSVNTVVVTVTPAWQRFSMSETIASGHNVWAPLLQGASGNSTTADILVYGAQAENMTGQQNQNPGDYVSVGVLASPFNGCGVDGVKCFEFYNGNTVTANVVTAGVGAPIGQTKNQSAYLPTVSTDSFSTPNAAANRITGDIDLRADYVHNSTIGSANLIAKDNGVSRCYQMAVNAIAVGKLRFFYASDGATPIIADSTVNLASLGVVDGTRIWARATYVTATGIVTFYYSGDGGATWIQVGAPVAIAAGAIFAGTSAVVVGASGTGKGLQLYQACIYNGINGPLSACFTANDWTSGGTFVSSATGETWTLVGNAKINNFPLLGYLAEEARTNLCLQSADLTTTWTVGAATIGSNVATAPDGTLTADKLQEDNTVAQHFVTQSFAKAASALTYTRSVWLKQAERTWAILELSAGANGYRQWFNLATGVLGSSAIVGAGFASPSATIKPGPNGWYLCTFTCTTDAAVTVIAPIYTTTADLAIAPGVGVTGNGFYIWGNQLEQAAFATSYIATTTAAVTRNADNLNYPTAGNMLASDGTSYCEATWASAAPSGVDFFDTFPNGIQANLSGAGVLGLYDGIARVPGPNAGTSSATAKKIATTWTPGRSQGCVNAVLGVADTWVTPALGGTFWMGNRGGAGSNIPNGTIKNAKLWKAANGDSFIQRATT